MAKGISCAFFLVFVITATHLIRPRAAIGEPNTWIVDDNGPADFRTIKDAINVANSGDTILVRSGTYHERVVVSKPILVTGENRETTIVDAGGSGTALQITTSGVTVSNLSITNAGRNWGLPPSQGFPDSAIIINGVANVQVWNNFLSEAAVCVWVVYSSFVSIADNTVSKGVYGGIIGYASTDLSILRNNVDNCGLMGLHLDGNSNDCIITDNTVTNNLEGLELEFGSSANRIEWNTFTNNNASIVLNECGGYNIFRGNAMSSSLYNFIIVGHSLESFLQDIDSSNTVNNRLVYFLTNLGDQGISPLDCPNAGWLALVNCTNVSVKDFDLFSNGDGLLLAYSNGCTLNGLIIGGNHNPLLWGGFIFYDSNNNSIVGCHVACNTVGLAFHRSYGNSFIHNSFVDNDRQVMSDFHTPFSNVSDEYDSENIWDNGYEGNYWSDYIGMDENKDGLGDIPYVIDTRNADRYPLINIPPIADTEPPIIWIISPTFGGVIRSSTVMISWEGADYGSGINRYEIAIDSEYMNDVGLNTSYPFTDLIDGSHRVRIGAFDNAGNAAYQSLEFFVDTDVVRFAWSPYVEAVVAIVIVITLGIAVYVMKGRYLSRIRKPSRKLVR